MASKDILILEELLPKLATVQENVTSNAEPEIFALLSSCYELLNLNNVKGVESIVSILLDKTWEDLNIGHWSSVPLFRRFIYSVSSLLMVISKVKRTLSVPDQEERKVILVEALKAADHGLLLGGQLHNELTTAAKILSDELTNYSKENLYVPNLTELTAFQEFPGVHGDEIPLLFCPSLESFFFEYFKNRKPVKLKDCINHWPAITKWKDLNYLINAAGERTVPVELGSRYDDSEWSQKLMNFREFIEKHVLVTDNKSGTGYLAQHQLFLQIPELKSDIREPEFCCCSDNQENDDNLENDDVDINAWFGPAGTVSPLHFDPKHNLLAQIVGRKRIILYDPKHTDRLHPHESKLLHNTAQVDPENPDYRQFPSYKDTPVMETVLNPGEMLYIPPQWWHHVRALDVSFSVSFWW